MIGCSIKKRENNSKKAFEQMNIRKPGSKFYLRLALISPQTIGPSLSAKVLTCLILMVAKKARVLNQHLKKLCQLKSLI